jgi:hypothetical protein
MASWRQSAKYYLKHVWDSDDRHLLPKFSACEVTCEMLHDLCFRYGVARTIPGHIKDLGVEGKYKPFADMLTKYRDAEMTRENVPGIVDREIANMREPYRGRSLCSAISKAFWMMKGHPVVIFDSFAWQGLQRLGLKPGYNTYREYFDSWFRFFEQEDTKDGLDDALAWLRNSPYTRSLLEEGYIHASELDSLWFRNRVTDVRLCFHGGADWLDG